MRTGRRWHSLLRTPVASVWHHGVERKTGGSPASFTDGNGRMRQRLPSLMTPYRLSLPANLAREEIVITLNSIVPLG